MQSEKSGLTEDQHILLEDWIKKKGSVTEKEIKRHISFLIREANKLRLKKV